MNDSDASEDVRAEMLAMGVRAKKAASLLRDISDNQKRAALRAAAAAIRASTSEILAANRDDMTAAKAAGVTSSVLDRLAANNQRIEGMVAGIEAVASLPDPVGRELARWTRPNGLDITRISTSIGVIGIIYESRPNVT